MHLCKPVSDKIKGDTMGFGGLRCWMLYSWICLFVLLHVWPRQVSTSMDNTVIWRCPAFNLLKCKPLPPKCTSFRMIYIRHGDLECPGCLICGDLWNYDLWPSARKQENRKSERAKQRKKQKRLRRKRQKEKKIRRISSKYNDIRVNPV